MGACLSGGAPANIITAPDGDEIAYHKRYLEDRVLGEGEFGVVKMVHDVTSQHAAPLASKLLRKGVQFKDNTLYTPIRPEILRGEVEMLRKLQGQHYCLQLVGIYETPRYLYMVTEFCGGGEMMEWVAAQQEDLRSEDVSRIAFQLFSAVAHCATNGILHRDIKPENCMFQDPTPKAELRLIDFGSGCLDAPERTRKEVTDEPDYHTTFAGSAFYIAPELFQRKYTSKVDVWSAGVALYVLVAGYPADDLQKSFNILQTASTKTRDLRSLPNLPDNLPDSFYELLTAALTYRHKKRPIAKELLEYEFVTFHSQYDNDDDDAKEGVGLSLEAIAAAAAAGGTAAGGSTRGRTASVSLKGSVIRHNLFLGYKDFERILTTLLATMLTKEELGQLLDLLTVRVREKDLLQGNNGDDDKNVARAMALIQQEEGGGVKKEEDDDEDVAPPKISEEQQLSVIPIKEMKKILKEDMKNDAVLEKMNKIPNAPVYDSFAYHVALLKDFTRDPGEVVAGTKGKNKRRGSMNRRRGSFGTSLRPGNFSTMTNSNGSVKSAGSLRGNRAMSVYKPSSVSGGRAYEQSSSVRL